MTAFSVMDRSMERAVQQLRGPTRFPITICYVVCITTVTVVVAGWLRPWFAFAGIILVAILAVQTVTHREVTTVHHLVNSTNDNLNERIGQLTATLHEAGVLVPLDPNTGRET